MSFSVFSMISAPDFLACNSLTKLHQKSYWSYSQIIPIKWNFHSNNHKISIKFCTVRAGRQLQYTSVDLFFKRSSSLSHSVRFGAHGSVSHRDRCFVPKFLGHWTGKWREEGVRAATKHYNFCDCRVLSSELFNIYNWFRIIDYKMLRNNRLPKSWQNLKLFIDSFTFWGAKMIYIVTGN